MIQATIINLHRTEYIQELHEYPFAVINSVSEVVIVLMTNLIEYVFQMKKRYWYTCFNMITGKNEWKTLTKAILCKCNEKKKQFRSIVE